MAQSGDCAERKANFEIQFYFPFFSLKVQNVKYQRKT